MSAPAAAPTVRSRALAPGRALPPTRGPRRVSGPDRPAAPARPAPRARPTLDAGLVLGALELARGISRHRLLDRLIRGRAWIVLVAFALLGIVTLQLALLKLNTSVGRSLERGAVLQRENAALSIENSELTAGGRVESNAVRLGMSLVPAGALKFLTARPHEDPARAAGTLSTPAHTSAGTEEASAAAAQAESTTGAGEEGSAGSGASSSEASETPSAASSAQAPSESSAASSEASSAEERASATTSASGASSSEAGAGGGTQASPTG